MSTDVRYHVIALTGPTGSGKSTVADYLVGTYGFRRVSIAQPLKEIVRRTFELSEAQVYGDFAAKEQVDPRYNVSPRWLLQRLATEGIRTVLGEDFWIDVACREIFADPLGGRYVIDDLRFLNEAKRIFGLDAYARRVARQVPHPTIPGSTTWRPHPDYVHSVIFRLAGVQQGSAEFQGHVSETEQRAPQFEALIRDTITAPKSPGGKLLLQRFEESLRAYAHALRPDARAHLFPGVTP